jgi:hypothetical protein
MNLLILDKVNTLIYLEDSKFSDIQSLIDMEKEIIHFFRLINICNSIVIDCNKDKSNSNVYQVNKNTSLVKMIK